MGSDAKKAMQASDIMTTEVCTVGPDTPLQDVAKLLVARRISAIPVLDGGDGSSASSAKATFFAVKKPGRSIIDHGGSKCSGTGMLSRANT